MIQPLEKGLSYALSSVFCVDFSCLEGYTFAATVCLAVLHRELVMYLLSPRQQIHRLADAVLCHLDVVVGDQDVLLCVLLNV